jgi:hypothetical protein
MGRLHWLAKLEYSEMVFVFIISIGGNVDIHGY